MSDCDVLALTSRNEGTPVALIEAAAAGLPAIATDVGGVRDVVEDGVTGRLVGSEDRDALVAALDAALEDPAATEAMGERARSLVPERFSVERMTERLGELYRSLV
jgi:glycosyltransferase involved in cell wall biosynthesis